jgi:peptidylprolyl isomerase domain and WD repeat-containing protein 1
VVKGGDVVHAIERLKTDRNDKPFDEVKILNMEVKASVD